MKKISVIDTLIVIIIINLSVLAGFFAYIILDLRNCEKKAEYPEIREYQGLDDEVWEIVPESIKDDFFSKGYNIVTDDTRFGQFNSEYVAAYYSETTKEIVLKGDMKYNRNEVISHELGHFIDCQLGFISQSDEWRDITEREWYKYADAFTVNVFYGTDYEIEMYTKNLFYYETPSEFFAEMVLVYLNPDGKRAKNSDCPEAQEFIKNVIENYGKTSEE